MEAQLFYWTGVIIWWSLCGSLVSCLISVLIIAPAVAFKKVERNLWTWRFAADIAFTGFTQDDLYYAARTSMPTPGGVDIEDMLTWYDTFKKEAKLARDRRVNKSKDRRK